MRKLATIRTIGLISPIDGADQIEKATVDGWELVVKKNEFKVGQKCIYIEIDSVVPNTDVRFDFLSKKKYRVRTIRLKGQVSQGIAFPLDIFPECENSKVGDDVTELLKITKYDPEMTIEKNMIQEEVAKKKKRPIHKFLLRYKWYKNIQPKKQAWPSFISKTDEERIQNMPTRIPLLKGKPYYCTEKLDGQSASYASRKTGLFNRKFYVCSRNIWLKNPTENNYWKIAKKYNIEKKLKSLGKDLLIQGEIIGPGIQKNKYNLSSLDFYIFNIYNIKEDKWYSLNEIIKISKYLNIKMVPVLFYGSFGFNTVSELVEYSKGRSYLLNRNREGIVIRINEDSVGKRVESFKVINPDFLLEINKKS